MSERSIGWPPFAEPRNALEFVTRDVALAGGSELAFDAADWRDTLILVERGQLELECLGGDRGVFATGAILCLAGLPLRTLRNAGSEPVVLVAVSRVPAETDWLRRCPDRGAGPRPGRHHARQIVSRPTDEVSGWSSSE